MDSRTQFVSTPILMTPSEQQQIYDDIGKLKTTLFKLIGNIESIQAKLVRKDEPQTEQ